MSHLKSLFTIALATALLALPLQASAQKLIAVIATGKLDRYQQAHASFEKLLRSAGMGEDQAKIFVQSPNPDPMSWNNSMRKAVGVSADLVISYGAPVTILAREKAVNIPVLFADVYDPVALGIVKNLHITGGAISGVSSTTQLEGLLANVTAIKPLKKVAVLYTSFEQGSSLQRQQIDKLSGKYGFSTVAIDVKGKLTPAKALGKLDGADAVYLTESVRVGMDLDAIMQHCNKNKIPVFSQIPGLGAKGALLNLEADPVEQGQLLGVHALQLLKGQNILALPVRSPNKINLVVNQKSATHLGLTIPASILGAAKQVIK